MGPGIDWLIGARLLQGIGAGILTTSTLALMRETASETHLGRAMGLLGTMSALGTALGPVMGGMLLAWTATWRSLFLIQFALAGVALGLAVVLPLREGGAPATSPVGRRPEPRSVLLPNLAINLLVAAVMMATLVVGPFYLGFGLRLTEASVGLVMAVGPLISIGGGMIAGRAVDRHGAFRILKAGLIALAGGTLLLALLPEEFGIYGYVLGIAVLTMGYQLSQAANNASALADIPKAERGSAAGLLSFSRSVGLVLGAAVMGTLFAFGAGTSDFGGASAAALGDGMRLTFVLASGLMLAALGIACSGMAASVHRAREIL